MTGIPSLPLWILGFAIFTALMGRLLRRTPFMKSKAGPAPTPGHPTKLLLACGVKERWRDACYDALAKAAGPVKVTLLLECTDVHDAYSGEILEPSLRSLIRVVHARSPEEHTPSARVMRLIRRFVHPGEPGLVVVMPECSCRLLHHWDARLKDARSGLPKDTTVLSSPARCRDGVHAAFPTRVLLRRNGKVARGAATIMAGAPASDALPSVCWCAELTAGSHAAIAAFAAHIAPHSAMATTIASETAGFIHMVPGLPILEDAPPLESYFRDHDEGCEDAPCGSRERVGLRKGFDTDGDRIRKFGSSVHAKLSVEFA